MSIADEHIHHGAEIGLPRDLHRGPARVQRLTLPGHPANPAAWAIDVAQSKIASITQASPSNIRRPSTTES